MKIIEINENFDINSAEQETLYYIPVYEYNNTMQDYIDNMFYGRETKNNVVYCCSLRFITFDEDKKTALVNLKKGIEQYKKEFNDKLNGRKTISESVIEDLAKSNGGTFSFEEDDFTSFLFTVEISKSRNFAVYDIMTQL